MFKNILFAIFNKDIDCYDLKNHFLKREAELMDRLRKAEAQIDSIQLTIRCIESDVESIDRFVTNEQCELIKSYILNTINREMF